MIALSTEERKSHEPQQAILLTRLGSSSVTGLEVRFECLVAHLVIRNRPAYPIAHDEVYFLKRGLFRRSACFHVSLIHQYGDTLRSYAALIRVDYGSQCCPSLVVANPAVIALRQSSRGEEDYQYHTDVDFVDHLFSPAALLCALIVDRSSDYEAMT
jgi:hypothetical protein